MAEQPEREDLFLTVARGTVDTWRRAAVSLGYVTPSGRMAGQGNLSALFGDIAAGAVSVADLGEALEAARREVAHSQEGQDSL